MKEKKTDETVELWPKLTSYVTLSFNLSYLFDLIERFCFQMAAMRRASRRMKARAAARLMLCCPKWWMASFWPCRPRAISFMQRKTSISNSDWPRSASSPLLDAFSMCCFISTPKTCYHVETGTCFQTSCTILERDKEEEKGVFRFCPVPAFRCIVRFRS